jgi:hypothetical protein
LKRRNEDSWDRNIFGWRDRDGKVKINLSLRQFWSEFMYFQSIRYKENLTLETINFIS